MCLTARMGESGTAIHCSKRATAVSMEAGPVRGRSVSSRERFMLMLRLLFADVLSEYNGRKSKSSKFVLVGRANNEEKRDFPVSAGNKEGPMPKLTACALAMLFSTFLTAQEAAPSRPKTGKPEIFKLKDIRPGLKGYAWTVLAGMDPEPIPVEIVGLLKNQWGPHQDIILAKMLGKAIRTNVAGGMSGSPVYIDGKLVGAVALRMSVFSPDAICGITPIELMLEVNGFDNSRPENARTPDKSIAQDSVPVPPGMLANVLSAGASGVLAPSSTMIPIET